ncbi:MAG: hypothetical protein IJR87_11460 [Bacteroidaceae bacterium]|nr:hypothetical protein [Bacteroidaceae bacterium]
MKRTLLSVILLIISLSGIGQNIGDAFYIYRNDGQFNAFFRDEVDSIAYSHYDSDSVYYNEIVTQLVYTADSLYRIPLAAIDSVGFVQPETIFQPNVVQMEQKGLMDYLQAVDGMSLLFQTTIPRELRPQVGEVLLYTDFDNPLLSEGFAGKVLSAKMTDEAFRVDCDSIYDIFEIFEQLISIEKIVDESTSSRRRVSDEWISNRNSLNFDLGFSRSLSDGKLSLSGYVDGNYIATVTYNITRKEQYIKLKIDHDWQYGAHLNFKKELGSFGTLKGPVVSLPAIRFPFAAPVFKFQISGCPFVKGEGNMELDLSLSSPVHSYVGEAVYRNGHFSGWNHKKPVQGSNTPNVESAFSLNGSVQAGYMVDLWLGFDVSIKGIAEDLLKVGTGLDFYIGPNLSGDFSMKIGSENPVNYYSIYKDSKIGIDWLHVDYEFFGEASLAGHKFPRAIFCEGSLPSPLNHEWYIMPEFSDLSVVKDREKKQATISTTPSRDILFPLSVGMGLYDSDGKLLSTKYESKNYKRENEGFEIQQTFSSLETGKEYTAKPFIRILGGEIPALPVDTFQLKEEMCPDENHPHAIDLGLPSGTKWCCCNVGASKPEEYGGYYAWGETNEKDAYTEDSYAYTYTAYDWYKNADLLYFINIGSDISGTSYDVAFVRMGPPWRMPSHRQQIELINNCSHQWTRHKGVNGLLVTGTNGGKIFLPAADFRTDYTMGADNDYVNYWSSTFYTDYKEYEWENSYAYGLYFNASSNWGYYGGRDMGNSVRAVCP